MSQFDAMKQRTEGALFNTYGRYPLAIEKAEGCRLYDFDGREYIDLLSGIAVVNVGHCRPEIADAIAEQARRLVHVSNLFYQSPQVELAEKLVATSHADKVFFCNSGAEANEAAVKLARRYMQKVLGREAGDIITFEGSFHGRTLGMISATGQTAIRDGFAPVPPGFKNAPWNDIDALEAMVDESTAAIMVETVQGESGVKPMTAEFAKALEDLCRRRDILLIVDEIQTGLCRTGRFWAHQHFGIEPDIFTSAKGLASGLPMGAMMATDRIAAGFVPGSHATTFGGGPVVAAAALKTIEIMNDEKLADRAAELGEYALGLARSIREDFPGRVADVRGLGLMLGIELTEGGPAVWKALLDRGFVLNLAHGTILRLLPPLTIAKADIDAFFAALREVLAD